MASRSARVISPAGSILAASVALVGAALGGFVPAAFGEEPWRG
jgi:hypothetical protein